MRVVRSRLSYLLLTWQYLHLRLVKCLCDPLDTFFCVDGFCRPSVPWPVRLGICFGGGVVVLVLYFRLFLTVR